MSAPWPVSVALIHFRTCDALANFEPALASLAQQDLSSVAEVLVYDNASDSAPLELVEIAKGFALPRLHWIFDKHGEPSRRTHGYSVNRAFDAVTGPAVFLMRSDHVLAPGALAVMVAEAARLDVEGCKPFVSGWCWHTDCDRDEQPFPEYPPMVTRRWEDWLALPGYAFRETDQDAGVFVTLREYWTRCQLNERLTAWGYGQSTWQRQLKHEQGVTMVALPQFVFVHQQHGRGQWQRDHRLAREQYNQFGEGK